LLKRKVDYGKEQISRCAFALTLPNLIFARSTFERPVALNALAIPQAKNDHRIRSFIF
jgi:hypothetical protein